LYQVVFWTFIGVMLEIIATYVNPVRVQDVMTYADIADFPTQRLENVAG
jgi:hypothetical protein